VWSAWRWGGGAEVRQGGQVERYVNNRWRHIIRRDTANAIPTRVASTFAARQLDALGAQVAAFRLDALAFAVAMDDPALATRTVNHN
jgi:hypothetical protein